MFDSLSDRLRGVFKKIRGHGRITEKNIEEALREVRIALLEADVNYRVVKDFIEGVKGKALGEEVLLSVTPSQQFIKIVRDELTRILGGASEELVFKGKPSVIMMVGLQGSGKTTTTVKLARFIRSRGRSPYVVPADLSRPAAVLQLKKLSDANGIDCFDVEGYTDPVKICREALRVARIKGYDTLVVDTAGRLHIDDALMDELKMVREVLGPQEVLFVADAMTGQDAVKSATGFDEAVGITGIILTKLDGDARGGAALSMRMVTGKPIKFVGLGEKADALEVFHPDRLSGRILDMGDVLTLVEKAQEAMDEKKAMEFEKKIRRDSFTLEDFREHLLYIKKMGPIENILSMIPGFSNIAKTKGIKVDELNIVRVEAIINSMTREERKNPSILNARRRIRIAKGSGTTVQDVNRLVKQYNEMRKMMKVIRRRGAEGLRRFLPM